MDGCRHHVIILILGLWTGFYFVNTQTPTATEPKDQYGDMHCILNGDGLIEATILIIKNNSRINRAYFSFENYTEYTGADCQFTGTGEFDDPFTATVFIDPNTDQPPTGRDNCGHNVITSGDTYEWLVYTQRAENFHMDGNIMFRFQCNTIPSNISITWTNLGREVIELPSAVGSLALTLQNDGNTEITTIDIGTDFFPTLTFVPSPDLGPVVDQDLYPWGAYCERFFVTPDDATDRVVELLETDGCPVTGRAFDGPFIATKPAFGETYTARAGPLEAWLFDKTPEFPTAASNTLRFTCHARLCWRASDENCINRCPTLRKKRSLTEDDVNDLYVITTTMTMREKTVTNKPVVITERPDEDAGKHEQTSGDQRELIYIVAGVGGAVALLIIVTTIVCCCCCFRNKRQKSRYPYYAENTSINSTATMVGGRPKF